MAYIDNIFCLSQGELIFRNREGFAKEWAIHIYTKLINSELILRVTSSFWKRPYSSSLTLSGPSTRELETTPIAQSPLNHLN
jgi:hypothetical protein